MPLLKELSSCWLSNCNASPQLSAVLIDLVTISQALLFPWPRCVSSCIAVRRLGLFDCASPLSHQPMPQTRSFEDFPCARESDSFSRVPIARAGSVVCYWKVTVFHSTIQTHLSSAFEPLFLRLNDCCWACVHKLSYSPTCSSVQLAAIDFLALRINVLRISYSKLYAFANSILVLDSLEL